MLTDEKLKKQVVALLLKHLEGSELESYSFSSDQEKPLDLVVELKFKAKGAPTCQ